MRPYPGIPEGATALGVSATNDEVYRYDFKYRLSEEQVLKFWRYQIQDCLDYDEVKDMTEGTMTYDLMFQRKLVITKIGSAWVVGIEDTKHHAKGTSAFHALVEFMSYLTGKASD